MIFKTALHPLFILFTLFALAAPAQAEPFAAEVAIPDDINADHLRCQVEPTPGGVGSVNVRAEGEVAPPMQVRLPITVRLRSTATAKAEELEHILNETGAELLGQPTPEPETQDRLLYRVRDASPQTIRRIEESLKTTIFVGFPEQVSVEAEINPLAAQRANVVAMRRLFDLAGSGVTIALHEILPPQAEHGLFTNRQFGESTPLESIQYLASTLTAPICEKVTASSNLELYSICHATHVMGSLAADAGTDSGMAPRAVVFGRNVSSIPAVERNLAADAADAIHVSNHSYGRPFNQAMPGVYDDLARFADQAILAGGPLAIAAAGNNRKKHQNSGGSPYPCSPSTGIWGAVSGVGLGKNALMVGAVQIDVGALAADPDARELANFSNAGPTNDGRIKPELTARGVSVHSSGVAVDGQFKQSFFSSSGTSMATPIVTGIAALLQELAEKQGESRGEPLSAVELRAVLVNGACSQFRPQNEFNYAICEGADLGPNYEFGYGEVDALASGCSVAGVNGGVETLELEPNEVRVISFLRARPAPPRHECEEYDELSITLAWLDDPGPELRQDLDMWLIPPNEPEILSWRLDPRAPSAPAVRAANHIDTLEKITLSAEEAQEGLWRLAISARRSGRAVKAAIAWTGLQRD